MSTTTTMKKVTLPSDADASGRSFGDEELELLREVIESGTLNCTKGSAVKEFETRFAAKYGVPLCRAMTSGTARVHTAVAAIDPEPGDEIVTTPITDMGALTPILYQGGDPGLRRRRSADLQRDGRDRSRRGSRARTRAIIVTHLFGNPCDMDPIMELARAHGIPVIEDCAQAFGAAYATASSSGTIGDIGCFSLQQGKHMTTGEGGIVVDRRPDATPAGCACSSTRPGATATRSRTTTSWRSNYRMTRAAGRGGAGAARQARRRGRARIRAGGPR